MVVRVLKEVLDFWSVEGEEPKEGAKEGKKEKAPTMVLTTDIIAMISPEGERVQLSKGLKARGNVEDWLGKVEESMFLSLRKCMKVKSINQMVCGILWIL